MTPEVGGQSPERLGKDWLEEPGRRSGKRKESVLFPNPRTRVGAWPGARRPLLGHTRSKLLFKQFSFFTAP